MEHILRYKGDVIDFGRYLTYVKSIKNKLPTHVYDFASNLRHFDLESASSLHDAWLESLVIQEIAEGKRGQVRHMEIILCLMGSQHDRRIRLRYAGVASYEFLAPLERKEKRYNGVAHGDLYTHEIRLGQNDNLIHEIFFEEGTTFLIECSDIIHSEEMIEPVA